MVALATVVEEPAAADLVLAVEVAAVADQGPGSVDVVALATVVEEPAAADLVSAVVVAAVLAVAEDAAAEDVDSVFQDQELKAVLEAAEVAEDVAPEAAAADDCSPRNDCSANPNAHSVRTRGDEVDWEHTNLSEHRSESPGHTRARCSRNGSATYPSVGSVHSDCTPERRYSVQTDDHNMNLVHTMNNYFRNGCGQDPSVGWQNSSDKRERSLSNCNRTEFQSGRCSRREHNDLRSNHSDS